MGTSSASASKRCATRRLAYGLQLPEAERDMNTQEPLRYVPVRDVESDLGTDDVMVETPEGDELGRLDGFLVDSARRCLRYFVIRRFGPQSLTMARVPFVPARLDSEQGVLRLLDDAPAQSLA